MTAKEIEPLIALARKHGLRRLKVGEVEFELGSTPPAPAKRRKQDDSNPDPEESADPLFDAVT